MYMTPPASDALLLVKVLLLILNEEFRVCMTPPILVSEVLSYMKIIPTRLSITALLLVKVLLVMLNEDSTVDMTPPPSATLLVKVLLVTLNEDSVVAMTPPKLPALLVKVLYTGNTE